MYAETERLLTQSPKAQEKIYILENLGCANCAAKMEEKIGLLPGVESATVAFATKQLRLKALDSEGLLPQIQQICASIEADVRVVPKEKQKKELFTTVFTLENLGCANCAAKMEKSIAALPGVNSAAIAFPTKQLRLTSVTGEDMTPQIQKICASIEPDVMVIPKEDSRQKSVHQHTHDCDHDHVHESASAHGHEHTHAKSKNDLVYILIGAALFILGLLVEHFIFETYSMPLFLIAYLILGGKVLLTAAKNIKSGHVFDENFLMSIATIGAIAIGDFGEAVGVMLFYRVGEFFEDKAVEKSRSQIMDAVDMRPEVVNLVEGETTRTIDAEDAAVGDILLVRPGDRIPLDGVVTEGQSRIDTSPVTGEPVPVAVEAGSSLISGGINTSGLIKMRVEKPLSESMVSRILESVENAAASKPKLDRFITRFARIYTPIVVGIAVLTAVVPSLITGDWNHWVYTALTFLVISCPCALVLSVPLAFFAGIGAGSKQGILFKGGVALEALNNVKAVVMDKTGTITKGNFVVQKVAPLSNLTGDDLLSIAASAESTSTHPIAVSILNAAQEKNLVFSAPTSVEELAGKGLKATFDDDVFYLGNRNFIEEQHILVGDVLDNEVGTEVLIANKEHLLGFILISDTIKDDAASAITELKKSGLVTAMLTGDSKQTADVIAKTTGIDEVHAKLLPDDKVNALAKIRGTHGPVMFIGDGINDAPVLAGADVGAAMGSGADAAIEAADVVFMNSQVGAIPKSIEIGKRAYRIAIQNVIFALTIKILVMALGLLGFASMWMAVFADSGVALICVLNAVRILYKK